MRIGQHFEVLRMRVSKFTLWYVLYNITQREKLILLTLPPILIPTPAPRTIPIHIGTNRLTYSAWDLVDADQGDPQYARLTGSSTADNVADSGGEPGTDNSAGTGTPGVISVMRNGFPCGFH